MIISHDNPLLLFTPVPIDVGTPVPIDVGFAMKKDRSQPLEAHEWILKFSNTLSPTLTDIFELPGYLCCAHNDLERKIAVMPPNKRRPRINDAPE